MTECCPDSPKEVDTSGPTVAGSRYFEDGFEYSVFPLDRLEEVATLPHVVVHLVRHAQGVHNLAFIKTKDRKCYQSEELADAKLTAEGEEQCRALHAQQGGVHFAAVFTSSLSRTVQTAQLGLGLTNADGTVRPFIALDLIRERSGMHPCDRRRPATDLQADFPFLDVSVLKATAGEEDTFYKPDARESWDSVCSRAERFLTYLRETRPCGERVAAVTHNDFLQALLLKSRLQLADKAKLGIKFANAQCLPVVLTWKKAAADIDSVEGTPEPASGAGAVDVAR